MLQCEESCSTLYLLLLFTRIDCVLSSINQCMHIRYILPLFIAFPSQVLAEINTLEDALAHAYLHDAGFQAEQAKLRATDEQVSQALSGWRPNVSAAVNAGKANQSISGDVPSNESGAYTTHDEGVTITQPIFQGFRTEEGVHSAKANVLAERAALQTTEQQLMLDTARAYLDVLQGQDLVTLTRQTEDDLQQELAITHGRFNIGDLTRTDIDQARSRLKAATAARLQAEGDLANKRKTFARLVGEMPGILAPPRLSLQSPQSMEEAMSLAANNNPNVIQARYTHEAAQSDVRVAEGSLLPEVNLVGTALQAQDQNPVIPQPNRTLSVVARLTVPLYDSGLAYSKTRAARQTVTQRRNELDDARNKAREEAGNAWQSLITAKDMVAADKDVITSADKALYGVRKQARTGTRTTLDVLNAEQELLNSKISFVKASHDSDVALLQVKSAIGQLTARSLRLPVDIYDPTVNYKNARGKWFGTGIDD